MDRSIVTTHKNWVFRSVWRERNGRLEPISLELSHPRMNGAAIRSLPLGTLLAQMRQQIVADDIDQVFKTLGRQQRGRTLTPEVLSKVAQVYRLAYSQGEPVQRAVAEAFDVAPSTATKRIMAARKAGLLEGIGGR